MILASAFRLCNEPVSLYDTVSRRYTLLCTLSNNPRHRDQHGPVVAPLLQLQPPPGTWLAELRCWTPIWPLRAPSVSFLRLKRALKWLHDCAGLADYTHVDDRSDNTRIERRLEG